MISARARKVLLSSCRKSSTMRKRHRQGQAHRTPRRKTSSIRGRICCKFATWPAHTRLRTSKRCTWVPRSCWRDTRSWTFSGCTSHSSLKKREKNITCELHYMWTLMIYTELTPHQALMPGKNAWLISDASRYTVCKGSLDSEQL
jgi:hypothetical protein